MNSKELSGNAREVADMGIRQIKGNRLGRPIKLSVLIPVYNEAPYIEKVLHAVCSVKLPERVSTEIICVDDGSLDGTSNILGRFNGRVKVHHSVLNFGKGTAIKDWYAVCGGRHHLNPGCRSRVRA